MNGRFTALAGKALLIGAALSALAMAGCAGPDRPKPKPLEPIANPIAVDVAWKQRIPAVRFPLATAVNAGVFTVASSDGIIVALQADTGRELWRGDIGTRIAAGVGSDGHYAAVVSREGDLVVLEAGRVLWRKPLGLRVTSAPLVAGERVFVLGLDRSVHAFDAQDGSSLWSVLRPGEALTLAQAGVVMAFKDTLLVGQGPRLTGLDPLDGSIRFEAAVATPRGANEVERLADLIAPASRQGDVVCARAFQSAVGCVDAQRGTIVWTKNVGGNDGIAADAERVYAADASDRITAWKAGNGDVLWTSDKLMNRVLGAPLVVGDTVLFGDGDGVLHFLARDTGNALLRMPTDGSPLAAAPVQSGNTVLAVTRDGGLFALRLP